MAKGTPVQYNFYHLESQPYIYTRQCQPGQTRTYYQIDPTGYSWGFVVIFTCNDRGSKYTPFYSQ